MRFEQTLTAIFVAVACASPLYAQDLARDFDKALSFDPGYLASLAERDATLVQARQSAAAYYPEASFNTSRLQTDTGNRRTFTITQPIFSVDRWAMLEQAAPRTAQAEAGLLVKQQDLALRLLKAANAIILASENLQLNQSKIDALEQQSLAAEQKYKLGQGTVTDLRDLQVKAKQARAQQLTLQSQQQVAAQQYAALVGERPVLAAFALPQGRPALPASSLQVLMDQALQVNSAILSARASEQIAALDVKKARGSLMPTVSASYSSSKSGSTSNNYTGVTMNVPLQAGSWLGVEAAQANALRAQETRKEAESKTRVEAERLYSLIQAGDESLRIQREAIAAAELSVEANRQSYQGGVRSAVDVINAIQTVFQVKSDYATMAAQQAENHLSLATLAQGDTRDAALKTFRVLFAKTAQGNPKND